MAQQYQSATFGTLTIPQAVAAYNVQTSNSGLAANGIVMIVGEADAGPDYTLELDLNKNSFGPNSVGDVIAKYQSGPIVDAVSAWSSPANDENIPGSPTAFIIAKTNKSTQAVGNLVDFNDTTYATIGASLLGAGGNTIQYQVTTDEAEVVPTTGLFTVLVPIGTVSLAMRVNGGAKQTATVAADTLPSGWASALAGITGITVTGGANRGILTSANNSNTLALAAVGDVVTFTLSGGTLQAALTAGDTLWISTTSDVATATGNSTLAGSYVITSGAAAGGTAFVAQKLQDASGTPGTLTAVSIGTASVTLTTAATDLEDFSPLAIALISANTTLTTASNSAMLPVSTLNVVSTTGFPTSGTLQVASSAGIQTVSYTGTTPTTFTGASGGTGTLSTGETVALPGALPVDGLGKSLEIAEITTGSLTSVAYALSPTKVIWVSTAASPTGVSAGAPLVSDQEYVASLNVNNVTTNTQETLTAGGQIGLELGYAGTTAQVVVGPTSLVFTWTGGQNLSPGNTLTLTLKNFATIGAIASFLNAQPGFNAQASTGIVGMLPSSALDEGTFQIGSTYGTPTGRIKTDAYQFLNQALGSSVLLSLVGTAPAAGLPAPTANFTFLTGGARGGSSNANITGALDALQNVVGNFTVTLFSQDASPGDILVGETDPSSTYTIDLINAYAKTNALLCSQPRRKKSRQAFTSILNTFAEDQDAAGQLASFRCSMCFQSCQTTSASAQAILLFQPWMLAGYAASMQAAAGYKGIVNKYINCQSIIQAGAGAIPDYNDQNDDNETTALQAGLLPAKRDLNAGGVFFVSDQTTFGSTNFVFNSIQAVYVADTMALTLAMRMQRAFVGQSLADISAAQAVSTVQNILADFLTLKLIAPSDGAPKGYQPGSIVCKISGTVMTVNLTVYLAGLLYFVPIVFQINQVQQSASA